MLKRIPLYIMSGFLVVYFFNLSDQYTQTAYWLSVTYSTLFTAVLWEGNLWIVKRLRRQFPEYRQTHQRIMTQIGFCAAYTVVAVFVLSTIIVNIEIENCTVHDVVRDFSVAIRPSLIGTLVVVSLQEAMYFFKQWRTTILEAEQLKRENIASQFETLKSQVNPHFLFNSLNTLITLIPEDPQLAVAFVQKLSNVYRYVLQNKDKELVTLAEEMKVAEAYLFLLKTRFGENLRVHMDIPPGQLGKFIAPLTLQMLLENAIKHNVVSAEKPLHIDLYVEKDEVLVVKNNLQRKSSVPDSTQTGLANISQRYRLLCQQAVEVVVTASNFMVVLPLLTVERAER
jgi:LytS/YehU family sensor histidine kinase